MTTRNESDARGNFSDTTADVALLDHARDAAHAAYAPYSTFPVGAAIRTTDGDIITGCNIENASYGLTNCAERTATFRMIAEHHHVPRIDTIAIVGLKAEPCWPCGACRQVLREFGCTRVIVEKNSRPFVVPFDTILPYSFGPEALEA
ncbi:cytidine deaminase [Corynebacterium kroppenstedtii]|uniref:cytidine deaminase n=1 Tax=Corynebacterium sp. PCR 32 TaxID=3351342 RepID=UPI0030AF3817